MPELGLESGVASACEGYGWPSSSEIDALAPATRRFQDDYGGTCWIAQFCAGLREIHWYPTEFVSPVRTMGSACGHQ